jgi:hypothetical protein
VRKNANQPTWISTFLSGTKEKISIVAAISRNVLNYKMRTEQMCTTHVLTNTNAERAIHLTNFLLHSADGSQSEKNKNTFLFIVSFIQKAPQISQAASEKILELSHPCLVNLF